MTPRTIFLCLGWAALAAAPAGLGESSPTNAPERGPPFPAQSPGESQAENWNWHVQNTDIVQGYTAFPAKYSGPNSLGRGGEVRETVSLDLMAGARLWPGAEGIIDGLMWQGFGLAKTLGVEAFPNGEGFRLGTTVPNITFSRVFVRQTIGLGGDQESVPADALDLQGRRDFDHLTLTVGKIGAKDIFDNNAYANDTRVQFMNWGLLANEAWDYPADSLGFMTGMAVELYLPPWAFRYGFFQMPRSSNGMAQDQHYFEAWGMVAEIERRYILAGHPGALRFLAYLNRAHMGSYEEAVESPVRPAGIIITRAYRYKGGVGVNWEQEIAKNIGVFSRIGWSDGRNEAWAFADVDRAATAGLSVRGQFWGRPDDTVGLGGVLNAISRVHQHFLEAGGTGILAGDGALSYGPEESLEIYYQVHLWKTIYGTADYQFVNNPAYNRARGPVSVFATRLHWEF